MSKTPASRKAADRRRIARRRAEALGLPADAAASLALPSTSGLFRLGLRRVTDLAVARHVAHASAYAAPTPTPVTDQDVLDILDALTLVDGGAVRVDQTGVQPGTSTTPSDARAEDRRARAVADERRISTSQSHAALAYVLARPCSVHDLPAGVPCWTLLDLPALCGARCRAAGFHPPVRRERPRADWGERL